jgi:hypothetical protein
MTYYERNGQTRRETAHAVVFITLNWIEYHRNALASAAAYVALGAGIFLFGRWTA